MIRLKVEHLPGERDAKPVWLWSSRTGAEAVHIDRLWQAYLRRFDLEGAINRLKHARAVATRYDKRGYICLETTTAAGPRHTPPNMIGRTSPS